MPYVGEARDGLPNHPVPQKARRTMTNLRTRLKTSSSGHPPQVGTMFPALKNHSQAPYEKKKKLILFFITVFLRQRQSAQSKLQDTRHH